MEELRKELWDAMHAEGEGANLGDTAVYPVMNIKENRWVVTAWNEEMRRFEQGMRQEHSQGEEDPEREGVRGYLGLWVEGHHLEEEGWVDFPSKTISIKMESSSGQEENSMQGRSENCVNPDSQGMSSGYTEEMVVSRSHK